MKQSHPTRFYDIKAVKTSEVADHLSFGWVRSNEPVPGDISFRSTEPLVLMKRKFDFADNPVIADYERTYNNLAHKKYRSKPLLAIISFILMLAFFLVAIFGLYCGISHGLDAMKEAKAQETPADDEKPENASPEADGVSEEGVTDAANPAKSGPLDKVKAILSDVESKYFTKVASLFDGKTNEETSEYTPGIADKLASAVGAPISYFISGNTIVGLIALVLAIIFVILFAAVCGQKKKRLAKEYRMEEILDDVDKVVYDMKRKNPSLMGKSQRKQYMLESAITSAIRAANEELNRVQPDDEDIYY